MLTTFFLPARWKPTSRHTRKHPHAQNRGPCWTWKCTSKWLQIREQCIQINKPSRRKVFMYTLCLNLYSIHFDLWRLRVQLSSLCVSGTQKYVISHLNHTVAVETFLKSKCDLEKENAGAAERRLGAQINSDVLQKKKKNEKSGFDWRLCRDKTTERRKPKRTATGGHRMATNPEFIIN